MKSVPESDWKVFKKLHPIALDRFCRSVLKKASTIVSETDQDNYEAFSALYKLVKEHDKDLGTIFNDYRRSTAFLQIAMMYNRNLLTEDEFNQFSPETTNAILAMNRVMDR